MASHVLTTEDAELLAAAAAGGRRAWARVSVLLFLVMVAAAFAWTCAPAPRLESLAPSVQAANNAAIALFVLSTAIVHGLRRMGEAVRRRWRNHAPWVWAMYGLSRQAI